MRPEFIWTAIAVITVLSAGRITRLITWDALPTSAWIRMKWDDLTEQYGDWNLLFHCPWCMSFWVTLGIVLWGYFTNFHEWWWLVNGIFAAAYVAPMIVVRDGDDD
jgi:hypothetical protein